MNYSKLVDNIYSKGSFLCVGLDTDYTKLPKHLKEPDHSKADAMLLFNKTIIDATAPYAVAFKPNVAFYECEGLIGWQVLIDTIAYIKEKYPDILVIADAKRGDIGNTSRMYARTFFDTLGADAVTVAPYMGEDSISPFLVYDDKWTVILGLTSNAGSQDFQQLYTADDLPLYKQVLETARSWGGEENTMFVVGATQAPMLEGIREIVPDHFLLVPGVGAQGGSLEDVARYGMIRKKCGLLVNASRSIIYASDDIDFAGAAAQEAAALQDKMTNLLFEYGF